MSLIALLAALLPASTTIHPQTPGVAVSPTTLQGMPLCVWNDSSLFSTLRKGMLERGDKVFRFPNGSFSDVYHWNGTGTFTADSIWVSDDTKYTPGWRSVGIHRGITTSTDISLIADGDTSTFWWSNPDNPANPGWFLVDLAAAKAVDSVALWLGKLAPDSVRIVKWTGAAVYPPPYENADATKWVEVARLPAADFIGLKLPAAQTAQYFGVRPLGATPKGWQAREFMLFNGATAVTKNLAATTQTLVYATSAHPAGRNAKVSMNWDFEAFMTWMKNYPGSIPLVCVNYGTGTPEEAAAWVNYANKVKGYGIKRWQVGNEQSGQWEENGCVSARQYAERYVKYAQAMRAVDPTIEIEGPVLAGIDFTTQASGDFDGRSWMEGFLHYVDSVEKATATRLVDGIDFHNYPYYPWPTDEFLVDGLLAATDGNGAKFDSLVALMARTISSPLERRILMTEFNGSTMPASAMMDVTGGTAAALQFAHFIERFGDRGLTNTWELYTGILKGEDETYGSLSVLVKPTQGTWSSLNYPPNASFWTTRTILRQWLDEAGGDTIMSVDQVAGARLFAVRNQGRVSILALNLSADSTALAMDPSLFPTGGDLLSWGSGEYKWIGTDAVARALPDNGPSSRLFGADWTGSVKIPPYGMVVVRGAGRAAQPLRTGHWMVSRTQMTTEDTLVVSGWSTLEAGTVASGTWTAGELSGMLLPTDGAWGGSSESWKAVLPAAALGEGTRTLVVSVKDGAGAAVVDSVKIEVTGGHRVVGLIADFEKKKAVTVDGLTFYPYAADGGKATVTFPEREGTGFCMRDSIDLTQPADLSYTNFGTSFSGLKDIPALNAKSGLLGIVLDYNTMHSKSTGTFSILVKLSTVKDYDDYTTTLVNTKGKWTSDTILFADLSQGGWGKAVSFEVDSVTGLGFAANGAGTIVMQLDNIYFLGSKGEAIGVKLPLVGTEKRLSLAGRKLNVAMSGEWVLRTVSADGRTSQRWTGKGRSSVSVSRTASTQWAILEGDGVRRILAIPPVR
jgi:hypothetical protein